MEPFKHSLSSPLDLKDVSALASVADALIDNCKAGESQAESLTAGSPGWKGRERTAPPRVLPRRPCVRMTWLGPVTLALKLNM